MQMTEEDILLQLSEAEEDYQRASRLHVKAKKAVVDAETIVIEAKLRFEKFVEALRIFRNSHVQPEVILRDQEIEKFRQDHPELVELAKERDRNRK
jgi:hypothetical protein